MFFTALANNYNDIKRSLINVNLTVRERGQRLHQILDAVKKCVNDRGPSDQTCDSLALYFVEHIEEAQSLALIPDARLEAVKANFDPLVIKTVGKALGNKNCRFFLHAVCFLVLSAVTFYLLANTADTWKEICAAFMPQVFTVLFNFVEYSFKAETARLDANMKVILVLSRGNHLLEEMTTV